MEATSIGAGTTAQPSSNSNTALRGLDMDHFLKLMITELQNQDPLSPMENDQILAQIGQIREIESTDRFRDTLDTMLLGQNLANAGSLINQRIDGLSDSGAAVQGVVERVTIAEGNVRVHVGEQSVKLKNIREILPAE